MKKAQLFQQPIFYIFVLIVAALFLTWGIRSVFQLKATAEQVELLTSVQDLKNEVNKYYTFDIGSNKQIEIRFPSKIKHICFTNHNPIETPENFKQYEKLFKISKYNTFIFPVTAFKENAFTIEHLTSKQDPLCIQTKGSLKAIITKIGESVEISI